MEKQTIYIGIAAVIIIIIAAFFILTNEKSKFIGSWQYSEGGTITFNNDNTATIDGDIIGTLILVDLTGTINYEIANQQVTFTAGSVSITLDYTFQNSNTLILINGAGNSITLTKI